MTLKIHQVSQVTQPKVIAAIPCFNTEASVTSVVSKARKYVDQVIVIDDGSHDGTANAAESAGATVIKHGINTGYGGAVRSCFETARSNGADALVILDGDGQHRLAETERLTVSLVANLPWRGRSLLDKTLFIATIIVILGAIGTLSYAIVSPKIGERFTEFYVTGLDGQLVGFSEELTIGEEGQVVVSVANHEHEVVSYQVEVRLNGMPYAQTTSPELDHGEKWVDTVSFVPDRAGDNQKVELILYKMGDCEPYRGPLRLLINVSEPE